jgi:hypothetical protein
MKPSPPMTRIKRFEDEVEGEEVCELPKERYGGLPYSEPDPGVVGGVLASEEAEEDPLETQLLSMAQQ